ncbi:hypothetical protein MPH_08783 [Macrophomina phaseolina MS6]|uniref:Uncharacterized protein n=1 Tax=Macrophomina phaseolina (strain MS6) TaxID=1126212 RepID=K2QWC7_MACPH|nr:hypothetical protein MPH_08783 [Macrophomina phaseolina MS6]
MEARLLSIESQLQSLVKVQTILVSVLGSATSFSLPAGYDFKNLLSDWDGRASQVQSSVTEAQEKIWAEERVPEATIEPIHDSGMSSINSLQAPPTVPLTSVQGIATPVEETATEELEKLASDILDIIQRYGKHTAPKDGEEHSAGWIGKPMFVEKVLKQLQEDQQSRQGHWRLARLGRRACSRTPQPDVRGHQGCLPPRRRSPHRYRWHGVRRCCRHPGRGHVGVQRGPHGHRPPARLRPAHQADARHGHPRAHGRPQARQGAVLVPDAAVPRGAAGRLRAHRGGGARDDARGQRHAADLLRLCALPRVGPAPQRGREDGDERPEVPQVREEGRHQHDDSR